MFKLIKKDLYQHELWRVIGILVKNRRIYDFTHLDLVVYTGIDTNRKSHWNRGGVKELLLLKVKIAPHTQLIRNIYIYRNDSNKVICIGKKKILFVYTGYIVKILNIKF